MNGQDFNGTVVITGGAGFVGKYLLRELLQEWPASRIVVWDKVVADLPDGVEGFEVDITNPDSYREQLVHLQPDWVVHLAAIASVPYALLNPEITQKVNVDAVTLLAKELQAVSPATKLFFVSTGDVYGRSALEHSLLPELSLDECMPQNPYAKSKLEAERVVHDFVGEWIIVRPFPHIGAGQARGFVTADFASQIVDIEKGAQEPVIRVGNLESKRDFTDVRDVVRAYRLLMETGNSGDTYNVASGKAVVIQDILDALLGMSTVDITVEVDAEKLRPSDSSKLLSVTGWTPKITLTESLESVINWWRSL